jgi:hypothetical protein
MQASLSLTVPLIVPSLGVMNKSIGSDLLRSAYSMAGSGLTIANFFTKRNILARSTRSIMGIFSQGGPDWTIQDLRDAPEATLDPKIFQTCRFQLSEIQGALMALGKLSDEKILRVVARPPGEWGITMEERVELVAYLVKRREELLALAADSSKGGQD